MLDIVSNGKVIALEVTIKLEDNQVVLTNVGKDPFIYTHGADKILPGIETAVKGMAVGQSKHVIVAPKDGFGDRNPNLLQEVPKDYVPKDIQVGASLNGKDGTGHTLRPTVAEIREQTVVLDFNHPLAGKTLFIDLKVVNITPSEKDSSKQTKRPKVKPGHD